MKSDDPGHAPGWCVHYQRPAGAPEPSCDAGVPMTTWDKTPFALRPCYLTDSGESKPGAVECPHLRRPTKEEIDAHLLWRGKRLQLMATVMEGVYDWRVAHRGKSASAIIECPACKGQLHVSIAANNGHMSGRCETPGCAAWIE